MASAISPAQQARADKERSKANRCVSLADMTPEQREKVLAEVNSVDRSKARVRAEEAKRGKR